MENDTLMGGRMIEVTKRDGSKEQVLVLEVPVRQHAAYVNAMGNECAMVEVLTGKNAEWVDSLTHASFEAVITVGDELNADFFARKTERQNKRLEQQMPGVKEALVKSIVEQALAKTDAARAEAEKAESVSALPGTSPKPAPKRV